MMLFRTTKLGVGSAAVMTLAYVLSVGPIFSARAQTVPTCDGREATIVGDEGDNHLVGTSGDDVIVGLGGSDTIDGGPGGAQDALCGNDGNDQVEGPDITGPHNWAYLSGGDGNDLLLGGSSDGFMTVRMDGGPGDDTLDGRADVEHTYGHLADYASAPGPVVVDLQAGIATGHGTDTLLDMEGAIGSHFDDRLSGNIEQNKLWGNAGTDHVYGLEDNDLLSGGEYRIFSRLPYDASVEGNDLVEGGEGNDYLYGGFGNDRIYGGTGDDVLQPLGGDDQGYGGPGRDQMGHSLGTDSLHGGGGTDFMRFLGPSVAVKADLREGIVKPDGHGVENVSSIEDLIGSLYDDVLLGNRKDNRLTGSRGDDVIAGRGGDDLLEGLNHADRIDGGRGFDTIDGGDGNNDRCSRGEVYIRCEGSS